MRSGEDPDDGYRMYVVTKNDHGREDIYLGDLFATLLKGRLRIFMAAVAFGAVATVVAMVSTEWYRVEVLLSPTEERNPQGLASQFGGLATLAGIDVEQQSAEPIAVLRSRQFAREFIVDAGIAADLVDIDRGKLAQWLGASDDDDIRDAVATFRNRVLFIDEDSSTGLVTLIVEWPDPSAAATWASSLIVRLNERMRERALVQAEANLEYLRRELATTNVVAIQQSIGRLVESELQKLMLARGNEEYAFRVIDPAYVPKYPVRPNRILIIVFGSILGLLLGSGITLLISRRAAAVETEDSANSSPERDVEKPEHA